LTKHDEYDEFRIEPEGNDAAYLAWGYISPLLDEIIAQTGPKVPLGGIVYGQGDTKENKSEERADRQGNGRVVHG
jgi:hypothetical protein